MTVSALCPLFVYSNRKTFFQLHVIIINHHYHRLCRVFYFVCVCVFSDRERKSVCLYVSLKDRERDLFIFRLLQGAVSRLVL